MEFIQFDDVKDALEDMGVSPSFVDDDHLFLEPIEERFADEICYIHLADSEASIEPREGARVIQVEKDNLADAVECIIGALHLTQVVLVPVGKWRSVFDAVAFSLASNEDWQEFDAAATVELNTRDPILCDPGDYHTLHALIKALLSDAETRDQGMTITSTATPFIAEIVPEGAVRLMVGNPALADEIEESLQV